MGLCISSEGHSCDILSIPGHSRCQITLLPRIRNSPTLTLPTQASTDSCGGACPDFVRVPRFRIAPTSRDEGPTTTRPSSGAGRAPDQISLIKGWHLTGTIGVPTMKDRVPRRPLLWSETNDHHEFPRLIAIHVMPMMPSVHHSSTTTRRCCSAGLMQSKYWRSTVRSKSL